MNVAYFDGSCGGRTSKYGWVVSHLSGIIVHRERMPRVDSYTVEATALYSLLRFLQRSEWIHAPVVIRGDCLPLIERVNGSPRRSDMPIVSAARGILWERRGREVALEYVPRKYNAADKILNLGYDPRRVAAIIDMLPPLASFGRRMTPLRAWAPLPRRHLRLRGE